MKSGILGVADHFPSEQGYVQSWTDLFAEIDSRHPEEASYTLTEHPLLAKLIHLHGQMDSHPILAYNANHEVLPYDTVLPARQQHIEGNDNVTVGDEGSHVNIPDPEAHADRSNPIYDLRVGHMCAFAATSAPTKKKAAARPIWLAECVAINFEKEEGLFRWWITKTATADWRTSGWQEDNKYKYGSGQGVAENGKVGEWLSLLSVIYWGFTLCPYPPKAPKQTIYAHDVNEIRHELNSLGHQESI